MIALVLPCDDWRFRRLPTGEFVGFAHVPFFWKEEVGTEYGHTVRAYSLERTICDCLRSRNKLQSEVVFAGLKGYVRRSGRNLTLLMKTAEKLGVALLLRTYLEVLV